MSVRAPGKAKGAKRDFGSFQSSNVQELVALPSEEYQPPDIPVDLPRFLSKTGDLLFGAEYRKKHFWLDNEKVFLNHGAFGCVLREALEAAQQWRQLCEKEPVRFLDRQLLPQMVYVIRRLAAFVDCSPCDLVLVPNVSTAMSCVVLSLARKMVASDIILYFNVTYGATKKLLRYVKDLTGVVLNEVTIQFPVLSVKEVMDVFEASLELGTKLVVLDHICSYHGIVLPVKEMIQICHQRGVLVLVDGAHALGMLPLSIIELGADFYVTNCHKWFCGPKGTGLMFVSRQYQDLVTPVTISHGFEAGYSSRFTWTGLQDYAPFLALHTVLDWWLCVGPKRIRDHMISMVRQGAEILQKEWNTELLADVSMFGAMVLVRLPDGIVARDDQQCNYGDAELVQNKLFHDHHIEVPVKAIQGCLYVRISAHVHNDITQYVQLAHAVVAMTKIV